MIMAVAFFFTFDQSNVGIRMSTSNTGFDLAGNR